MDSTPEKHGVEEIEQLRFTLENLRNNAAVPPGLLKGEG